MNKVNYGSNYTHRVTLRLNEEQYNFLIQISEVLGVSPSDYVRMVINSGMVTSKSTLLGQAIEKGTVGTNENVKTNSNDIVQ